MVYLVDMVLSFVFQQSVTSVSHNLAQVPLKWLIMSIKDLYVIIHSKHDISAQMQKKIYFDC